MKEKKNTSSLHLHLLYATTTLLAVFLGYNLWTKGLFVDSIFYGAVAQNLAQGFGDYWYMSPTRNYYFAPFQGHPPLGIWLLSWFMQLFDSQFWVERLFSLCNLVLLLIGIYQIWSISRPAQVPKSAVWWVFLLWIVMPINIWSYGQYTLENTMSVFIVWSIYIYIKAMQSNKPTFKVFLGGLLVTLATFVKGPVGLFPIIFPLIHWIVFRQHKWYQILLWLIIPIVSIILFYGILYFGNQNASEYLTLYWKKQLVGSLQGSNNVTESRFYIIKTLCLEGVISWIVLIMSITFNNHLANKINKWGLCFLLVALAGSLPILLSPKQMNFYIIPSLPFLALSAALLSSSFMNKKLMTFPNPPKFTIFFLHLTLIIAVSISIMRYGKYARDEAKIEEILLLNNTIPSETKVIIHGSEPNYLAECYAVRYANLYLNNNKWYLTEEEEALHRTPYLLVQKNYRSILFPYYIKNDSISSELTTWDLWEAK